MSNLSCIALLDKFSGDLDELLVFAMDEWTPSGWDSGGNEEELAGVGVSRDTEIVGDVGDDNLDDTILFSLDAEVTSLDTGRSKLPSLEVFTRIAAAAAAAAATLAAWEECPDKHVETPLVIVTLDPVGDGIDL